MDAKEATRLLQERIKLLHEYNDVKETTIVLMTHASIIKRHAPCFIAYAIVKSDSMLTRLPRQLLKYTRTLISIVMTSSSL